MSKSSDTKIVKDITSKADKLRAWLAGSKTVTMPLKGAQIDAFNRHYEEKYKLWKIDRIELVSTELGITVREI